MTIAKKRLDGDGFNFETLTVADSAVGLSSDKYRSLNDGNAHIQAHITITGGAVRYRYDDTNPTATVGHILSSGDTLIVSGTNNVNRIRFIRMGSTSGTLSVTYEAFYG